MDSENKNQIKVFIADNNEDIRKELKENFTSNPKFKFIGDSADGEVALNAIKTEDIDILILDVILINIDGFELLEKLRNLNLPKKPKVIIVSKLTKDTFISNALDLGASYYIAKPITFSVLEKRIDEVLSKNKPFEVQRKIFNRSLEEKISNIFITVGIPAHIKGYQFLREAIKLAIDTPEIINAITKKLYPSIAEKFSTSSSKVERAIRHAIEVAWNRGKIENINTIFGLKVYASNEKPTNGEFIALVADKMLIEGA